MSIKIISHHTHESLLLSAYLDANECLEEVKNAEKLKNNIWGAFYR